MTLRHCVAIDLGASSGRVILARFDKTSQHLTLQEIHRFPNHLIYVEGFTTWDLATLEHEIRIGLQKACDEVEHIDSLGIDTWGWIMSLLINKVSA